MVHREPMYWALNYNSPKNNAHKKKHNTHYKSTQDTSDKMLQHIQLRPVVNSVKLLIPVCKRNEIQSFLRTYAEQRGSDLCLTIGQSQLYSTTNPHLQHNVHCKKIIENKEIFIHVGIKF